MSIQMHKSKYTPLLSLLHGAIGLSGVRMDELASAMGFGSKSTLYSRLRSPWNFSIGELDKMARKLGIESNELQLVIGKAI